MTNIILFNKKM